MRHAYGEKSVKIIALVRAPLARLRAAFAHYAHYAKAFGEGEDGFDAFVATFVDEFQRCEADARRRNESATRMSRERFRRERSARFTSRRSAPIARRCFITATSSSRPCTGRSRAGGSRRLARRTCFLRTEDAFSSSATVRKRALNRATHFLGLHVGATDDVIQRMDACDETSGCVRGGDATLATLDFGEGVAAARAATRERVDAFFEPETTILAELFGDRDEASSWAAWGRGEATEVGVKV